MRSKKVIAILCWDTEIGGISTKLRSLISRLKTDQSLDVHVLLKRKGDTTMRNIANLNYHFFSQDTYRGKQVQFSLWLFNNLLSIKPDYIIAFLNRFGLVGVVYKLAASIMNKAPKVIIGQEIVTSLYLRQHESWYWPIVTRFIFHQSDTIITVSRAVTEDMYNNFSVPLVKIRHVPNWIKPMKTIKISRKKYDCIFVGRLSPEKGLDTVLDTADYCRKARRNFSLSIVGDGPLKSWLVETINKRGLSSHVTYFGYHNNPRQLIKQSRLLLLPSYNEGLPMVILEAYSVGVPVAVTPFLGAEEAVEHNRTGIIVEREGYPQAVCALLANNRALQKMGRAARRKAEKDFSMKNLDRFIEAIFSA